MIPLPDGFALRPFAGLLGLLLAALALLFFLAGRRAVWHRAVLAALLGMALFLLAVFAVQAPLQVEAYRALANAVSPFWLGANPWLIPLVLALFAGLCQEAARLLAIAVARRSWPKASLPLLGAIVGAGVGGIEAAMVLGAIPPAQLHLASLAVLERVGAVPFHTGAGAVLGLGLAKGRAGLAFLAVLALHVLIDFFAAALSYGIGGLALTEAISLAVGLGLYLSSLLVARRLPAPSGPPLDAAL